MASTATLNSGVLSSTNPYPGSDAGKNLSQAAPTGTRWTSAIKPESPLRVPQPSTYLAMAGSPRTDCGRGGWPGGTNRARYSISRKNGSSDASAGRSSQFTPRFSGKSGLSATVPFTPAYHRSPGRLSWRRILSRQICRRRWPLVHAPLERHETWYESPTIQAKRRAASHNQDF